MSVGTGKYMNARDGDVVELTVVMSDEAVSITHIEARGCHRIYEAARALAEMTRLKTPEEAARVEPRELIERLGLDAEHERCALTAIAALRAALVDAHVKSVA